MYAGLAGVCSRFAYGRIVPESFGFLYSLDFLVMIVLGGLGLDPRRDRRRGPRHRAAAGLRPLRREPAARRRAGRGRVCSPCDAARFLYGAAVVAVLIFVPGGLAGLGRHLCNRRQHNKESTA